MIDKRKVATHEAEMAKHTNGAALFLDAFFGGKYISNEQAREMLDYILAETKRNIESCPFASQTEKDAEIHRKESIIYQIKREKGLL